MRTELTNLLPLERGRALSREYVFRVGVVVVVMVTMLTLAAAVLLVPTYVFLTESTRAKKERLAHIESSVSSAEEAALSARLATLSTDTASIVELSNTSSVSTIIRDILTTSRPGITLLDLTYAPSVGKSAKTMTVSGVSATRVALNNYQLALQRAPGVLSAVVPVSSYAKDTDITFSVTITLAP